MQVTRSSADTVKGPADWFARDVHIDAVAAAPAPSRVTANLVHFMPGARTTGTGTPNRLMVHLAVNEADEDHDVVHRLEPATDEEYTVGPADR